MNSPFGICFSCSVPFVSVFFFGDSGFCCPSSVHVVSVVLLGPCGVSRSSSVLGCHFSPLAFTSRPSLLPHHPSSCIAFMAYSLSHLRSQTSSLLCRNMSTICSPICATSRKDRYKLRIGAIIILATLCYCEAGKSLPKAKPKAIIKAHDTKQGAAVCKGKQCTTQAQSGHQGYCKSCFRVHFPELHAEKQVARRKTCLCCGLSKELHGKEASKKHLKALFEDFACIRFIENFIWYFSSNCFSF